MATRLREIHHVLIDMDGVLYRGQTGLPGGPQLLAFLEERGIGYLLVTNNSTLTQQQFSDRLGGMGIRVAPERVMTSGMATAAYLAERAPAGTKVCVVGESAVVAELEKRGFVMGGRESDYVVCGWDKGITYEKLATAALAIRDGAIFVGTNADKTYPLEKDIIPGAGSILAMLIAATDVQPIVVGKPEPIILEQCLRQLGATAGETALLGDRLDTDILGGHRAGIATIMVTTGINTAAEAEAYDVRPDYVYDGLPALIAAWKADLSA